MKQACHKNGGLRRLLSIATVLVAVVGLSLGLWMTVFAVQPSNQLTYQGRLLNSNGVPVSTSSANMQFRLYDAQSGGTCLWSNDDSGCATNANMSIGLTDGLFTVNLGNAPDGFALIPDSVFGTNSNVFLEVEVDGEVLSPRKRMTAAPYAMNAQTLDGLSASGFLASTGDSAAGDYDFTSAEFEGANPLVFDGSTDDTNDTTFTMTDPTGNRTVTFPDADLNFDVPAGTGLTFDASAFGSPQTIAFQSTGGTVAYLSDIGGGGLWSSSGGVTFRDTEPVTIGSATAPTYGTNGVGTLRVDDDFETIGEGYFENNLVTGAGTSSTSTLSNGAFSLGGDDLFVAGTAGIEGEIYTDAGLTIDSSGETLTLDGNAIDSSGTLSINTTNNQDTNFGGDVIPATDDTYNLGSSTNRWADLYLGPASLHVGIDGNDGVLSYDTANSNFNFDSDFVPTGDGTLDIGSDTNRLKNIYLNEHTDGGATEGIFFGPDSSSQATIAYNTSDVLRFASESTTPAKLHFYTENTSINSIDIASDGGVQLDAFDDLNMQSATGDIILDSDVSRATGRLEASAHAANQGLNLPTYGLAGTPPDLAVTVEGDVVWNANDDALYVHDGTAFTQIGGGGSSLWQSGTNGTFEDDAGVIVGIDQAETLSNASFTLAAGDLFVEDELGVEGEIYTDSGLTIDSGTKETTFSGGTINSVGQLNINTTSNTATAFGGDIVPDANNAHNLGSDANRWADLYLGGNTLHIGASATDEGLISYDAAGDDLSISTDTTTNGSLSLEPGGDLLFSDDNATDIPFTVTDASLDTSANGIVDAINEIYNAGSGLTDLDGAYDNDSDQTLNVDTGLGIIFQQQSGSSFIIKDVDLSNAFVVDDGGNTDIGVDETDIITLKGSTQFEGATDDINETIFSITDPTADRTVTFPDADLDFNIASGQGLTFDGSGFTAPRTITLQDSDGTIAWEDGTNGTFEDDAGVIVGIDQAETLLNASFTLAAGDLFVEDELGVEGEIYTDSGLTIGATTTFDDGNIDSSGTLEINANGGALSLNTTSGQDVNVGTGTFTVDGLANLNQDVNLGDSSINLIDFKGDVVGNILPDASTNSFGDDTSRWGDVFVGTSGALHIGDDLTDEGTLSYSGSNLSIASDGTIEFNDTNLSSPVPLSGTDSGLNTANKNIIDAINEVDAAVGGGGTAQNFDEVYDESVNDANFTTSIDSGNTLVFDLVGSGDVFQIQDGGGSFATFDDAGNISFTGGFSMLGDTQVTDDTGFNIGSGTDHPYTLVYDSANTQFEMNATDIDGSGTDGTIFTIADGANDVNFNNSRVKFGSCPGPSCGQLQAPVDTSASGPPASALGQQEGDLIWHAADNRLYAHDGSSFIEIGGQGSGGSGSLDDAYNNGSSVTVDSTDVAWDLTSTNDFLIQDAGSTFASFLDSGNVDFANDLTVDSNTLFVDASQNEVGINTTSPSAALDVVGTSEFGNTATFNGSIDANSSSDFAGTATFNGFVNANGGIDLGNSTLDYTTMTGTVDSDISFEGSTYDANETTFAITDPQADRTITFPDETGEVVLDSTALWQSGTNGTFEDDDSVIVGGDSSFSSANAGIGDLKVNDELEIDGSVYLGDSTADSVSFNANVDTAIRPVSNNNISYDIGADNLRWNELYLGDTMRIGSSTNDAEIGYSTLNDTLFIDSLESGGRITMSSDADTSFTSSSSGANAIDINAPNGGVDIDSDSDTNITTTSGLIWLDSGSTSIAGVNIDSAGGVDIDPDNGFYVDTPGSNGINLSASGGGSDAIDINATGTGNGIEMNAAGASHFKTSKGLLTIENTETGKKVNGLGNGVLIRAAADEPDAIKLDATAGTEGGIILDSINNIDMTSSGSDMTLDANGDVDITASNGDITLSNIAGGLAVDLRLSTGNTEAVCHSGSDTFASGVYLDDCDGSVVADYMEMYPAAGDVATGDIVALGSTDVTTDDGDTIKQIVKSNEAYQGNVIGIASNPDDAGDFNSIGYNIADADNPYPVALNGRVPLNVTDENGSIQPGDPITASSTTGAGMKATAPGMIVGYALDNHTSGTGQVMVFVSPGYHSGMTLANDGTMPTIEQDVAVASTGDATSGTQGKASNTLMFRGSGWDGSQAQDVAMQVNTEVADASEYRLSVKDATDSEVAYISNNGKMEIAGDMVVGGKLYPSDRGTPQTDKYIYYDGSSSTGGNRMYTNADGWGSGASYDFAEMFPSTQNLDKGEVVTFAPDNEHVRRTETEYARAIAGVVSTKPGFLAGEVKEGSHPIALAGRVPTKVNMDNGPIAIGDPLTSSGASGVAMKATEPGMILGYALEPYDGSRPDNKIIAFINASYFDGTQSGDDVPGTENTASQVTFGSNNSNLSSLDMEGNIYMHGNEIRGIGKLVGLGERWSVGEDGTFSTEASYDVAIESYQGEDVKTHAKLAREHTVTLSGTSKLSSGTTSIDFEDEDPQYNDIISTQAPIRVYVTLRGPANGIYVQDADHNGFTVSETMGGSSDVEFDWFVEAYRKGYEPEEALTNEKEATNKEQSENTSETSDSTDSTSDSTDGSTSDTSDGTDSTQTDSTSDSTDTNDTSDTSNDSSSTTDDTSDDSGTTTDSTSDSTSGDSTTDTTSDSSETTDDTGSTSDSTDDSTSDTSDGTDSTN